MDFNHDSLRALGYTFHTLTYPNPAFHRVLHSFLITMHDSTREEHYLRQLRDFQPTRHVTIVYNRGYKEGTKQGVDTTSKDLWHANSTIMKLCSEMEEPVLILEDDVQFLPRFRHGASRVEAFLSETPGAGAYNLGCLPLLSYPVRCGHLRGLVLGFAHAVVYTRRGRDALQDKTVTRLHDLECSVSTRMYFHAFPLAVQAIEATENSKQWDLGGFSFLYLRCFGRSLFATHHRIGWFGGLGGCLLLVVVCCALLLVARLRGGSAASVSM